MIPPSQRRTLNKLITHIVTSWQITGHVIFNIKNLQFNCVNGLIKMTEIMSYGILWDTGCMLTVRTRRKRYAPLQKLMLYQTLSIFVWTIPFAFFVMSSRCLPSTFIAYNRAVGTKLNQQCRKAWNVSFPKWWYLNFSTTPNLYCIPHGKFEALYDNQLKLYNF